jgi:hypothetical protein
VAIRVTKAGVQIEYLIADSTGDPSGCLAVYPSEKGYFTVIYDGFDLTRYCTSAAVEATTIEIDATNLTSIAPESAPGGTSWAVNLAGFLSKEIDDVLGHHVLTPPEGSDLYDLAVTVGGEDCQSVFVWSGGGGVGAFVSKYKIGPNDPLKEGTTWAAQLAISGRPSAAVTPIRRWQSGIESGAVPVGAIGGETTHNTSSVQASNAWANTGVFSYRMFDDEYIQQTITATRQIRTGFYVNHNSGTGEPHVMALLSGSTEIVRVAWNVTAQQIRLYVAGALVAIAASAAFAATATAIRCGVDVNLSASGWIYVYIDGEVVIAYNGNAGGSTFDGVRYSNSDSGQAWSSYIYFDDLYIDDTTGTTEAALPPRIAIDVVLPNGDSLPLEWTPNSGSTHYTQIDDPGSDDTDLTYISTNAGTDRVTLQNISSLPVDTTINAVIPFARFSRSTLLDGGLQMRLAVVDDGVLTRGEWQSPIFGYTYTGFRVTSKPGNGEAWDVATVNSLELNLEVA